MLEENENSQAEMEEKNVEPQIYLLKATPQHEQERILEKLPCEAYVSAPIQKESVKNTAEKANYNAGK